MWATGGKGHRSLRGAYAELTRGLRAGTHKNHLEFLMSDMEVSLVSCGVWTVCVQQFEFGLCMYVWSWTVP